jgi:lipoprotein-anchoring transpeptidase ErfK/SrfK
VASSSYHVTATLVDRFKRSVTTRSSFSTLTPTAWVNVNLLPQSGLTVGVGQPIVLKFTQAVTDPAARERLLSHLDTSLSTPVPVGAYWFSGTELHLRPENFWPSGEEITFSDALDGWDAGGGMWGQGTGIVKFTIGDARISTANLATHQMTVSDNGNVVATYPISAGSTQYPTMTGTHIVLDRVSQIQMVSSTVGIPVNSPGGYDEKVLWDVHVSDSGEYVHAAPWSVSAQGFENVSHGCINLSPTSAQQFFGMSQIGDIVNVVDGPRPPVPGDHGVMDWETPWSSFTPITVSSPSAQSATSQLGRPGLQ